MEEYGKYFIIYGYVLPLAIMLVWLMWRVYSDLKAGERYVSHFIRDCLPLLIPGASLWGVCSLLLLAMVEFSHWLEKHWAAWRLAGEQSRSIARRMFGGVEVECPNRQPLTKEEEEEVRKNKAEDLAEKALKVYPKIGSYDNLMKREGFIEGYHQAEKDLTEKAKFSSGWDGFYYGQGYKQAEKDLALSWKDIADILDVTDVIANDDSMEERLKTMSEEEYCQEVLKRFSESRTNRQNHEEDNV